MCTCSLYVVTYCNTCHKCICSPYGHVFLCYYIFQKYTDIYHFSSLYYSSVWFKTICIFPPFVSLNSAAVEFCYTPTWQLYSYFSIKTNFTFSSTCVMADSMCSHSFNITMQLTASWLYLLLNLKYKNWWRLQYSWLVGLYPCWAVSLSIDLSVCLLGKMDLFADENRLWCDSLNQRQALQDT